MALCQSIVDATIESLQNTVKQSVSGMPLMQGFLCTAHTGMAQMRRAPT
jgi:hypothetical protein